VASFPARVDASITTVRRQFERRAACFAAHDTIVREVAGRMLERLAVMRHPIQRILDLGCGQGPCRAGLLRQFPDAQWVGIDISEAMLRAGRRGASWTRGLAHWLPALARVGFGGDQRICASAEQLPLADASVDLVFSNLMLHWHPAPHEVIGEIARVLRTGGLVLFSSYGPDTLGELRSACQRALPAAMPMPFVDMHDFGDMLIAARFESPVMEVENLTLTYPNARRLMAEVRALGGNPRADRARALPSGRQARALMQQLQSSANAQGKITLRFEVVIGHGWKAPPQIPSASTIAMPQTHRPPR
jgi:malonyl-CoA O-methyltransferase